MIYLDIIVYNLTWFNIQQDIIFNITRDNIYNKISNHIHMLRCNLVYKTAVATRHTVTKSPKTALARLYIAKVILQPSQPSNGLSRYTCGSLFRMFLNLSVRTIRRYDRKHVAMHTLAVYHLHGYLLVYLRRQLSLKIPAVKPSTTLFWSRYQDVILYNKI